MKLVVGFDAISKFCPNACLNNCCWRSIVCCKLATFVYIVSDIKCNGLAVARVVGLDGLLILLVDFDFLVFDVVWRLHASHGSGVSFSLVLSSFSLGGHKIKVDLVVVIQFQCESG